MVLLAVRRLGENAYGVPILRELEEHGRRMAVATVYATLDRLEAKGLVTSWFGEPTSERGGKAKRYFRLTARGVREARATQRVLTSLWADFTNLKGETT